MKSRYAITRLEVAALGLLGVSLAVWTWMGVQDLSRLTQALGYLVVIPQVILAVVSVVIVYLLFRFLISNSDHTDHRHGWG